MEGFRSLEHATPVAFPCRGAGFLMEPHPKYGEISCYIRSPDGYIIEFGQSTDVTYG